MIHSDGSEALAAAVAERPFVLGSALVWITGWVGAALPLLDDAGFQWRWGIIPISNGIMKWNLSSAAPTASKANQPRLSGTASRRLRP